MEQEQLGTDTADSTAEPSENKIIECKPKSLFKSKNVERKRVYAEKFCSENGFIYELMDPPKLTSKDIILDKSIWKSITK